MVEGVAGECIQLKHSDPGATGTVYFLDCEYECKSLEVKDGLVISGPGLSISSVSAFPICIPGNNLDDWEPCAE